jgi:hypothetical protein
MLTVPAALAIGAQTAKNAHPTTMERASRFTLERASTLLVGRNLIGPPELFKADP